jgi:hypothetical protein
VIRRKAEVEIADGISAFFTGGRRTRALKNLCRTVAVLFAITFLWASAFTMNPDGISSLDIGDAFFHGHWGAALNAHWSPLYSVLLGAVRKLFPVRIEWQFPLVHFVNFLIFLAVIPCFEFFWGTALKSTLPSVERTAALERSWWIVGYLLFLISTHTQGEMENAGPVGRDYRNT